MKERSAVLSEPSGGAVRRRIRIFDTMKNIFRMDMVSGPLRLKSASLGGGVQMAQDYGKQIGKKIT